MNFIVYQRLSKPFMVNTYSRHCIRTLNAYMDAHLRPAAFDFFFSRLISPPYVLYILCIVRYEYGHVSFVIKRFDMAFYCFIPHWHRQEWNIYSISSANILICNYVLWNVNVCYVWRDIWKRCSITDDGRYTLSIFRTITYFVLLLYKAYSS